MICLLMTDNKGTDTKSTQKLKLGAIATSPELTSENSGTFFTIDC